MGGHADTASARSRRQREATLLYRAAGWAVLRAVISVAVVVTIYYLLPWDRSSAGAAVTWLVIGLMMLIGLIAFQVRAIVRSPFPGPRAIEALATSLSLVLLLFAGTYVAMATHSASNFGEHLSGDHESRRLGLRGDVAEPDRGEYGDGEVQAVGVR